MFPTVARLSKASRLPLTPKRANKDFYKGIYFGVLQDVLIDKVIQVHDKHTCLEDTEQVHPVNMSSEEKQSIDS